MKSASALALAVVCLLVAACSNTNVAGTYPKGGALIPDTQLHVTPGYTLPLEKLIYWGAVAAVAYYVTDPLAPNWSIREGKFPDNHYRLSLQMKRYYTGGAGEARVVFNRRAEALMREGSYDSYQILDYSEGLESSVLGSQRVAEGTIVLMHADATQSTTQGMNQDAARGAIQGNAVPARSTAANAENPRS